MGKQAHKKHGGGGGSGLDYLAPLPQRKLRKQAINTIKAAYGPAEQSLNKQVELTRAISDKRAQDNKYYLDWLNSATGQLQAHAQAADQQLQDQASQIHQQNQDAYAQMRQDLVQNSAQRTGTVTNSNQSTAFDVSAEQQRGLERIGAARERTAQQIDSNQKSQTAVSASNFALQAANEANRVADLWSRLKDIGDSKQKLTFAKAADSAKEIARLLDREIQKAQIRGTLHNQAVTAGISAGTLAERTRHDKATEAIGQQNANTAQKKAGQAGKGDQVDLRARKRESRQTTSRINDNISYISAHPDQFKSDPAALRNSMIKLGRNPLEVDAAIQLYSTQQLGPGVRKRLKAQGYIVPKSWR